MTDTISNKPTTIDEWRNYIAEPWQNAVKSIIETGQRLIEAKKDIGHGNWVDIFKDNKPFSYRTANFLMSIAENSVLSNLHHDAGLPPSWTTLYHLSTIPEPLLLKMMEDGRVHSDLTREEAIELTKVEEKAKQLYDLILHNAFIMRELSLANCGGVQYDFSILNGYVTPELKSAIKEGVDSWLGLQAQVDSYDEVTS